MCLVQTESLEHWSVWSSASREYVEMLILSVSVEAQEVDTTEITGGLLREEGESKMSTNRRSQRINRRLLSEVPVPVWSMLRPGSPGGVVKKGSEANIFCMYIRAVNSCPCQR